MPPTVVIVGVACVVGAAAAVATWLGLRPPPVRVGGAPVPLDVVKAVAAVRAHRASAALLRQAAGQAAVAGHASLAAALRDEAAVLAAAEEFADAAGTQLEVEPLWPSPLPGVGDELWSRYVRRSRVARPSAVSPDNRYGCFALSARELADAGWLLDARKEQVGGRLCWTGTWAPDRDELRFLRSADEQHEALATLARLHARVVEERHRGLVGQVVEGQPATLSGLLGVCRRAGLGGLRGWATDAAQRRKFPETTAAYARLNGIF